MIQELRKLKGTPYLWVSLVAMTLFPVLIWVSWLIKSYVFEPTDLHKINLMLLASVHCKITFPALVMVLIKVDHDVHGIKSGFYLPNKKTKLIYQKITFAFAWMLVLMVWSLVLNTGVAWLMFKNFDIVALSIEDLKYYFLVVLLAVTMENMSFILVMAFKNYYMPLLIFIGSLIAGYGLQLLGDFYFIFSGLPKYMVLEADQKFALAINIGAMVIIGSVLVRVIKSLFDEAEKEIIHE